MTTKQDRIEWARLNIDDAIDLWLHCNGCTQQEIDKLDYSYLDNELNDLLYTILQIR